MFNANASYAELEQEMESLSESFVESPIPLQDFFVRLGNYFWSAFSARCAVTAYKLAAMNGELPHSVASRVELIGKSPFLDKMFVITGELTRLERDEALLEIRKYGGLVSDNPVNTMNYLILGAQEWSAMNNGLASRKVQKAAELQAKGKDIKIISEDDFYSMLDACKSIA